MAPKNVKEKHNIHRYNKKDFSINRLSGPEVLQQLSTWDPSAAALPNVLQLLRIWRLLSNRGPVSSGLAEVLLYLMSCSCLYVGSCSCFVSEGLQRLSNRDPVSAGLAEVLQLLFAWRPTAAALPEVLQLLFAWWMFYSCSTWGPATVALPWGPAAAVHMIDLLQLLYLRSCIYCSPLRSCSCSTWGPAADVCLMNVLQLLYLRSCSCSTWGPAAAGCLMS
jgi:hypothetical protein